ncbi:hypothetical protein SODALDRAFT_361986 [Sodiomyces alkalinus F11]|uniref:Uncharacterized protein n=1 Tax=Sodiomyces alkalinus (strain CBS 110278 / VKM F-3762 / F11) TaxID=1314773 RepID=A0A3N2PPE0_SODAK|nr:hypothetical protein SODALDRAFT_361986 [Sodiomyces alkalinus F11]ROT36216.1 hypothetical protein SODALDRAFT_361986 [Sodiomyces alkalinus F11]
MGAWRVGKAGKSTWMNERAFLPHLRLLCLKEILNHGTASIVVFNEITGASCTPPSRLSEGQQNRRLTLEPTSRRLGICLVVLVGKKGCGQLDTNERDYQYADRAACGSLPANRASKSGFQSRSTKPEQCDDALSNENHPTRAGVRQTLPCIGRQIATTRAKARRVFVTFVRYSVTGTVKIGSKLIEIIHATNRSPDSPGALIHQSILITFIPSDVVLPRRISAEAKKPPVGGLADM